MYTSKCPSYPISTHLTLIVYLLRKIKDIKQYTVDEGKKVNESLKAY